MKENVCKRTENKSVTFMEWGLVAQVEAAEKRGLAEEAYCLGLALNKNGTCYLGKKV